MPTGAPRSPSAASTSSSRTPGIASSAPIEETTLELWERNHDILARGYFLSRGRRRALLRTQGTGGSIVFVGSKNALAPGKGASAYSSAKAAELHLARCLAEELGPDGIRVNTVNPDAVLEGSRIWDSAWREERARAYGIAPERARGPLPRAHDAEGERPARPTSPRRCSSSPRRPGPGRAPATSSTSTAASRGAYPR